MTSARKTPLTLTELLAEECAHCALSKFLNLWRDQHPTICGEEIAFRVAELLGDVVDVDTTDAERQAAAIETAKHVTRVLMKVAAGQWKPDTRPQRNVVRQ